MAFGDGQNDLDLMEAAGIAVAMENGADNVKAKADYVTGRPEQAGWYPTMSLRKSNFWSDRPSV